MEACNATLSKYTDPMQMPINLDICEAVMRKVTDPFEKE